jgi:hypothetical protein
MEAPDNELTTLRAEVLRLKELMVVKDQLLISKDAQLASKDEVIASKVEVIACKEAVLSRTAEELQQYKSSAASSKPVAAGGDRIDAEQPCRKRQRVHNSSSSFEVASPLDKDEILDHVFRYVGGGDHLYVGGVSRRWRGRYMQYCAEVSSSKRVKKLLTGQRNVLISASRLQLALSSGLAVAGWTFDPWSCDAELECTRSLEPQQVLTLLQWLHSSSCPWGENSVLMNASRGGSVAMLEWLQTVTAPWSADSKTRMLTRAASTSSLAAAKWLRAQGAEWPSKSGKSEGHRSPRWSLAAVQWAIASGSGWLDCHCEDFKYAADVLNWAHANGCPCTCGHQQQQQ